MNWIVYLFGSGLAFFLGVGTVLVALALNTRRRGWPRVSTIIALLGILLIAASGAPFPAWYYWPATVLLVAWLIVIRLGPKVSPKWASTLCLLVALIWCGGTLYELRYQLIPEVKQADSRRLYLFGDSLSAGLGDQQSNHWPELLARSHNLELFNYARAGATVGAALHQANEASLGDGVVLLEIGGNDLLGGTRSAEFERNLERLILRVGQPGRQVVMFELPIPPLHNSFGRIQRRLAAQYHVLLIPKRVLVDVIAGGDSTLDSIHLSPRGHERMAEWVWKILRPAYEPLQENRVVDAQEPRPSIPPIEQHAPCAAGDR